MNKSYISLHRINLTVGSSLQPMKLTHQAIWLVSGALDIAGVGVSATEGAMVTDIAATATEPSTLVVFRISPNEATDSALLSASFQWEGNAVLRLDRVCFPPGARAYRHIHPGPGIRFLTEGELEIKSDHGCTVMQAGDAWFEGADSSVQATAAEMLTAFVRAMILPPEFLGKPTLRLLDAADNDKPRLQTNTRFLDEVINLSHL